MSLLKSCIAAATVLLCSNAFANINARNGFYIGGAINGASYSTVPGASISDQEFNGNLYLRPFVGYRINDYVAVEGGYNDIQNHSRNGNDTWGPDHYRLYSFDIAAKLIAPFSNGFSVFGKAGAAYTHQDVYNQMFVNGNVLAETNSNVIQPLLGVGVSYNFNENIATDVSFTHLAQSGSVGDINMLGLGLSYTFGNK